MKTKEVTNVLFFVAIALTVLLLQVIQSSCCSGADTAKEKVCFSEDELQAAMEKDDLLSYETEEYVIEIKGQTIVNPLNKLDLRLNYQKEEDGACSFDVNGGEPLPGPILVKWKKDAVIENGHYYIKNHKKDSYDYIGTKENSIEISVPGRYIVKDNRIKQPFDERAPVTAIGIVCVMSLLVFFVLNKRYWLW